MTAKKSDDEIIHYESPSKEKPPKRFIRFVVDHIWQLFLLVFVLAYANYFLLHWVKNTGWSDSDFYHEAMFAMEFDSRDHLWTINGQNVVEISPDGDVRTYSIPSECERVSALTVDSLDHVWVGRDACLRSFDPQAERIVWTDHWTFVMSRKDIIDLTVDKQGKIWVLAKQENKQNRFEESVFLYRFSGEKGLLYQPDTRRNYFRQPGSLVAAQSGRICFSHLYGMVCRLADGSWDESVRFWGRQNELVLDEQNRLWGLSDHELKVCDIKNCSAYTVENSGLERRSHSMAFDSNNKLWISNREGLRVLDENKILPTSTLDFFVIFNFIVNYLLLVAAYLIVISASDSKRKHIPPEITVRYGVGKLWVTWIIVGGILMFNAVAGDWNNLHSNRLLIATFLSIALFPVIRLLSLGIESKLSLKTFVLTLLLGTFLFVIVIVLPTGILIIFVNMQ